MDDDVEKTIHDRLRDARVAAGFRSATAGAKRVGKTESTYRAHENGQNEYGPEEATGYAHAFNVTAEWLLFGGNDDFKTWKKRQDQTKAGAQAQSPFKMVPEFDVHVSAGGGALVVEEAEIGRWPFNPEYLSNFLGLARANLAIVEVRGDSMEPTLISGDRVLVNMSDRQISQSGIFVLFDGGGTVVKRVDKRIGDDETVTLISDNPIHDRYQVDVDQLNVVGRVVWVARRL